MARNETPSEGVSSTGSLHQLLVLGGLGLFVVGLLFAGVFTGLGPSMAPDGDGGQEPPIGEEPMPPAEENEPSASPDDGDDGSDGDPAENDTAEADQGSPEFAVSALSAPDAATIGDTIEVDVAVLNRGDDRGTTDVTLRLAGEELGRESIDLEPGTSTTVSFQAEATDIDSGRQQLNVTVGNATDEAWIQLEEPGSPSFVVTELTVPENTTIGSPLEVSYTVRNIGDGEGTADVVVEFDGSQIGSTELSLAPAETATVTTSIDTSGYEPGDYPVSVMTPDGWDRAWTSLTESEDGEGDDPDESDDGDDGTDDGDGSDDETEGDDGEGDDSESGGDDGNDDGEGADDDTDDDDGDDDDDDEDDDGGIIDF